MSWIQVKPTNSGGGRKQGPPTVRVYESGLTSLSHSAVAMLGDPTRILVQIDPETERIRIMPTTPTNAGAFTLAGGGNTPHRITMRLALKSYPQMAGEYVAQRIAGGIECRKVEK